jgi:uncharacterized peroxidase-related enzyme
MADMTWIRVVEPPDAEGNLAEIYEEIGRKRGRIANIYKSHSLNPDALRAHLDLYMSILYRRGGLSRGQREMIGVLVSALNECEYCVVHHSEALSRYEKNPDVIEALMAGKPTVSSLSRKDRAMMKYCVKLTERPAEMREEDVTDLREAGFEDAEILDINLIASYFNFVNRVILGLGVPLERETEREYRY